MCSGGDVQIIKQCGAGKQCERTSLDFVHVRRSILGFTSNCKPAWENPSWSRDEAFTDPATFPVNLENVTTPANDLE